MNSRNPAARHAGFTLAELIVTAGVFSVLMGALMASWTAVQTTAVNATAHARRQNDEMRVLDYLKRDIRRATTVEVYDGANLVTDTTTFGSDLRLTIPDYYADAREEDIAIGTRTANAPTVAAGSVAYGAPLTVRYYVLNGAPVRSESGAPRTIGDAAGVFALSFKNESDGVIRCRIAYNQRMQGGVGRTLRRQLDALCLQRSKLQ